MSTLQIPTARVFRRLLEPARYKGAWGGRGSGKSRFFSGLMIEEHEATRGALSVCVREVQRSLAQSSKRLLEAQLAEFRLTEADGFRSYNDKIETPGDGLITFVGMQDHTAESIKSLEGFGRAWVEEAQSLSQRSLTLLRPTIRAPGSELWFSWNPRRKTDPVDALLRGPSPPSGAVVVQANWRDNPWFPAELERERLDDKRDRPDTYDQIWEGGYEQVTEGAYYAAQLTHARAEGRIGNVAADPLMTVRLFTDIGGTGARSDSFVFVAAQFVGREVRVVDHYEAVGQPIGAHLNWARAKGYTPARAQIWLPHDGASNDKVFDVSYESALKSAGYEVTVVPNQGKGAAAARIEAARRLFPSVWINEATTQGLIDALGAYHERKDSDRGIGLGPEHDWASHSADAFGLMAVAYEEPRVRKTDYSKLNTPPNGALRGLNGPSAGAWMGN